MFVFTSVVRFSHKKAFISIFCNKQTYSNDYFLSFKKLLLCCTEVSICQFSFSVSAFWHKASQECALYHLEILLEMFLWGQILLLENSFYSYFYSGFQKFTLHSL